MGHLQQQLHNSYVDSMRKATQIQRSKQHGDWSRVWRFRGSNPAGKKNFLPKCFQTSATLWRRSELFFFRIFGQRKMVVSYQRLGTPYRTHIQGKSTKNGTDKLSPKVGKDLLLYAGQKSPKQLRIRGFFFLENIPTGELRVVVPCILVWIMN